MVAQTDHALLDGFSPSTRPPRRRCGCGYRRRNIRWRFRGRASLCARRAFALAATGFVAITAALAATFALAARIAFASTATRGGLGGGGGLIRNRLLANRISDLLPDQLFDFFDGFGVESRDERDGDASLSGATCAPDTMDVIFRMVRGVVIYDVADVRNIETARRHI